LVERNLAKVEVASSSLVSRSSVKAFRYGPCGSVVEHSLGKGEVGSSILPMGTIFHSRRRINPFASSRSIPPFVIDDQARRLCGRVFHIDGYIADAVEFHFDRSIFIWFVISVTVFTGQLA
jgi:hypothetical protein